MSRRAVLASLAASISFGVGVAHADGPGLPNLAYPASDLDKPIGIFDATIGAPRGHGTVVMHRGYLAIVFSRDSGKAQGGFAFYDISDPRKPKLVARKDDAETYDIREAHGFGMTTHEGRDLVALQASFGVQIWDWTDVMAPKMVSYLKLPGITDSDYGTGAWWLTYQAPYIYVGGSGNGLYIVDATDPKAPKLVDRGGKPNPLPTAQLGGFRVGPTFAIGNLLVLSSMDEVGYATFDIGDPKNPTVLKATRLNVPNVYSAMVNGNRIYGAGGEQKLYVHDISNPSVMSLFGVSDDIGGKGGYVTVQDGFAFVGAGEKAAKVDVKTKGAIKVVSTATSGIKGRDEDFSNVLGNLVYISDDHGKGSVLAPHQLAPDTTPPEVNMVVPKNGATNQKLAGRVGLTFTDQIDLKSVSSTTFIVRKQGTTEALLGHYSHQTGIVNFTPDKPFEVDATYEVVVPEKGIKDLAGNATGKTFVSTFSTGATSAGAGCEIEPVASAFVGEAVSFRAKTPLGPELKYSWDFGDGTDSTPASSAIDAKHTFAGPGHYGVTLTVEGPKISTACTLPLAITLKPTARAPSHATTLLWSKGLLYASNADADTVAVAKDEGTGKGITKTAEWPVGKKPRTLAFAPDGTLWVVAEDAGSIAVLREGALEATIALPLGSRPFGLIFAPDGSAAYVTLGAIGKLAKLDPASRKVTSTIDVGPTPRGLAMSGDGKRILVTRFISDLDTGAVTAVDASSFAIESTFEIAYDKGPDSESSGRGVLNYLSSITISPDGTRAWFPAKKDNLTRGLHRDDRALTFESTVRAVIAQLDLTKGSEDLAARLDLNDRALPSDVVLTPKGDFAFVATQGTNTVEVLDAYTGARATSIEKVGLAPQALALDDAGKRLFVQNFLTRDVVVYDVRGIVDLIDNQFIKLGTAVTVAKEPLPPDVLLGKQIFYNAADERMSKDKYISCAACHLDGGDDGRVWDFTDRGEGLRNTTSLLGRRGIGHGRLHWSANFDEVQDFENDMRGPFGGIGFMTDDQFKSTSDTLGAAKKGISKELDALSAYVTSLDAVHASPHRNQDGTLTADGLAGLALFRSLKCDTCHSGRDLTDSATGKLHDVGTLEATSGKRLGKVLEGLDTPTLRGIWETAPYLHDGSAATLMDVLVTRNATGKHGFDPKSLNETQLKQLVAYLQQIDDHDDSNVDPNPKVESKGCRCGVAGGPASGGMAVFGLLLAALLRRRRRS